jgi:hypothetical protein
LEKRNLPKYESDLKTVLSGENIHSHYNPDSHSALLPELMFAPWAKPVGAFAGASG